MDAKLKKAYIAEVQYQTKMLNHLKKWLRNLIIFSSISFVLVLFGSSIHPFIQVLEVILLIISILSCALVGLGYKNGYDNVQKIINQIK